MTDIKDERLIVIDGKKLQSLRKAKKLSQTELGEAIGLTRGAIFKIESGGNTNKGNIEKLAEIFNIEFEELLKKQFQLKYDQKKSFRFPEIEWEAISEHLVDVIKSKVRDAIPSEKCFILPILDNLQADLGRRLYIAGQYWLIDPSLEYLTEEFVLTEENGKHYIRWVTFEGGTYWLDFRNAELANKKGLDVSIELTEEVKIIGVARKLLTEVDLLNESKTP